MTPTLAAAFVALLKADADVVAIAATRGFAEFAPDQTPLPYWVWQEITSDTEESHDDNRSLDSTDVQFSCYSNDPKTAMQLRNAIRKALTANGAIANVVVINPTSRSLPDSEIRLYNHMLDVTFMHNPSN